MSNVQYKNGTALLKELVLQSTAPGNIKFDISHIYSDFTYYESIDSPTVSAKIGIVDAIDMKSSLPIVGGETLSYKFADSSDDSTDIAGKFRLYKMPKRSRLKAGTDTYDLVFTTNEFFKDQYNVIDQALGPMPISDMVKGLFNSYIAPVSGKKLMALDPTIGISRQIFSRISPMTAIDYLGSEANSARKENSSVYFFFETADGYYFTTLEQLYSNPESHTFYYFEGQNTPENESQFDGQRIIAIEEEVGFDLLDGVHSGEFSVLVSALDPLAKTFNQSSYQYQRDFSSIEHSGGKWGRISGSVGTELGSDKYSFEKYVVTNASIGKLDYVAARDPELQQRFRQRQNFLAQETAGIARLNANKVMLSVYGDSSIRAGETIRIFYPPSGEPYVGKDLYDKMMSGKYLVTAVAHSFSQNGEYRTHMEVAKDTYEKPIGLGDF